MQATAAALRSVPRRLRSHGRLGRGARLCPRPTRGGAGRERQRECTARDVSARVPVSNVRVSAAPSVRSTSHMESVSGCLRSVSKCSGSTVCDPQPLVRHPRGGGPTARGEGREWASHDDGSHWRAGRAVAGSGPYPDVHHVACSSRLRLACPDVKAGPGVQALGSQVGGPRESTSQDDGSD